jgi:hypothetical protein
MTVLNGETIRKEKEAERRFLERLEADTRGGALEWKYLPPSVYIAQLNGMLYVLQRIRRLYYLDVLDEKTHRPVYRFGRKPMGELAEAIWERAIQLGAAHN